MTFMIKNEEVDKFKRELLITPSMRISPGGGLTKPSLFQKKAF
jgi:hypothetical protein